MRASRFLGAEPLSSCGLERGRGKSWTHNSAGGVHKTHVHFRLRTWAQQVCLMSDPASTPFPAPSLPHSPRLPPTAPPDHRHPATRRRPRPTHLPHLRCSLLACQHMYVVLWCTHYRRPQRVLRLCCSSSAVRYRFAVCRCCFRG